MKKKFIFASIIIALVVLFGAGYVLTRKDSAEKIQSPKQEQPPAPEQQKTEETISIEDWKDENLLTCRSEKYGYEFKYPKNWYMYNQEPESRQNRQYIATTTLCESIIIQISDAPLHYGLTSDKKKNMQKIIIDVRDQGRLLKTIDKGVTSREEYFQRNQKILQTRTSVKNGTISEEKVLYSKRTDDTSEAWIFHKNILYAIQFSQKTPTTSQDVFLSNLKFLE